MTNPDEILNSSIKGQESESSYESSSSRCRSEIESITEISHLGVESPSPRSFSDSTGGTWPTTVSNSTADAKSRRGSISSGGITLNKIVEIKGGSHFDGSLTSIDIKQQQNPPTDIVKPIPHQSSMEKTIECGIFSCTDTGEVVGRSCLNKFSGSIADPELSTNMRKESENNNLKLTEDSETNIYLGETLAQNQADMMDEVRMKKQPKSSPEDGCTPVIIESGDKFNFQDHPKPANEVSSSFTIARDKKALHEDLSFKVLPEKE